jgi:predicted  nucleic acid-binding Zn-ribbon protein
MYDRDGSNEAQLLRTYDIAKDRLAQMEAQRAELDVAIADLKTQLTEGEKALAAFRKTASAA